MEQDRWSNNMKQFNKKIKILNRKLRTKTRGIKDARGKTELDSQKMTNVWRGCYLLKLNKETNEMDIENYRITHEEEGEDLSLSAEKKSMKK